MPEDGVDPVTIENELKRSYLDYAMSVIVSRAIPDLRDGLKPVHRRILYTLWENGQTKSKSYRKCATAVGDVMGRYHPHGDSAVYDALVARSAYERATGTIAPAAIDTVPPSEAPTVISPVPTIGSD